MNRHSGGMARANPPVAIEVKWKADGAADCKNLLLFSNHYPDSELVVVAQDIDRPFVQKHSDRTIHYYGLQQFIATL